MEQQIIDPENEIIEKLTLEECISQFDADIQNIFYDAYGKTLEAMPKELLQSTLPMERFLKCLLMLNSTESQKIILMRLGFVSGRPMMLNEVADELGITRERVRQTENMFLRRFRRRKRLKKPIRDFYN